MSSFALYDYTETLSACGVSASDVETVLRAWGEHGDCAEWSGGFVLKLRDGRYAYATGWCDTTGWGCQDGAEVTFYGSDPGQPCDNDPCVEKKNWDEAPIDLNRWHADGAPADRAW
jgi:hypothetical protein